MSELIPATCSTPCPTDFITEMDTVGAAVIPGIYAEHEIAEARQMVLDNIEQMKNTRPSASSRHLAGFHRFPALEPLHRFMTDQPIIRGHMAGLCGSDYRTIGLTDITINRSQQWHKDLMRGKFQSLIPGSTPCADHHGKVFKVIVYLQDSSSLRVIPGSHKIDIPLDNDDQAIPDRSVATRNMTARAGDVVVIDICTTHRGSRESAFGSDVLPHQAKILVSTVFGRPACDFTSAMEAGNAVRLKAWDQRWGGSGL